MLNAARNMVSKFVDYFNNVDPEERDELTNKPVHKVKSIMEEVAKLYDLHESLEKYKALKVKLKCGLFEYYLEENKNDRCRELYY